MKLNDSSLLAKKKSFLLIFAICTMLAISLDLSTPAQSFAEGAHVKDIVRNKPYNRVVVSAFVKGAFTREIIESIESGAPVTFTYFIQLEQKRTLIWDKTVRKIAIKRMVKLDTLRKEYIGWEKFAEDEDEIEFKAELIAMEYKGTKIIKKDSGADKQGKIDPPAEATTLEPDRFKDIEQLKQWMTHLDKIDLGVIEGLNDKKPYYARVKCEMKTIKLVPPFNYILFFVALWNFDTDWGESAPFNLDGNTLAKATIENKFALLR